MKASVMYRQARLIILLGALSNIFLAGLKLIFGYMGHSAALVADGLHSLSDLLIDALVWFASHYGSRDADADHPYGHARIETAATMGLAILLVVVGLSIAIHAIWNFFYVHISEHPKGYVLWIIIFSLIIKEIFYYWSMRVAEDHNSELLRANAWHHRSDSASSLVVLVGVAGTLMGWQYFDVIAAAIVGALIVKMGLSLGWSSVRELVDTGLIGHQLNLIESIIKSVSGVRAIHQLRTRSMGGNVFVDVHVLVSPELSVSEGHFIGQQVHYELIKRCESVKDVTVHIDTDEEEDTLETSRALPSREVLLPLLRNAWNQLEGADQIKKIILHYYKYKIDVEVYLPLQITNSHDVNKVEEKYNQSVKSLLFIRKITLIFTI